MKYWQTDTFFKGIINIIDRLSRLTGTRTCMCRLQVRTTRIRSQHRNRYSKAYIYSTEFNNLVPFISLLLYLESIGFCTIYMFNYINTILLSLHAKWSKYLLGWKTYISFVYIVRLWDSLTENDKNLYHSQIKMN